MIIDWSTCCFWSVVLPLALAMAATPISILVKTWKNKDE